MAEYLLRDRLDDLKPHYKIQFLQSVSESTFSIQKVKLPMTPHKSF